MQSECQNKAFVLHCAGMKPELRAYKGVPSQAADELLELLQGMFEPADGTHY